MRRPASASNDLKLSPARRRQLQAMVKGGRFESINAALDFCVKQAARLDQVRTAFHEKIRKGDAGPFERVNDAWRKRLRKDIAARRRQRARKNSARIAQSSSR